jgi:hypothetical protein
MRRRISGDEAAGSGEPGARKILPERGASENGGKSTTKAGKSRHRGYEMF